MVKISVILPIYNIANFLEESLKSVLNQTLKDIEVICINDGSTDKTEEIAKSYVGRYPDSYKLINKSNGGMAQLLILEAKLHVGNILR